MLHELLEAGVAETALACVWCLLGAGTVGDLELKKPQPEVGEDQRSSNSDTEHQRVTPSPDQEVNPGQWGSRTQDCRFTAG